MTTTLSSSDGLRKFVIFVAGLAILGTVVALAIYFGMNLPAHDAVINAPANGGFVTIPTPRPPIELQNL